MGLAARKDLDRVRRYVITYETAYTYATAVAFHRSRGSLPNRMSAVALRAAAPHAMQAGPCCEGPAPIALRHYAKPWPSAFGEPSIRAQGLVMLTIIGLSLALCRSSSSWTSKSCRTSPFCCQ